MQRFIQTLILSTALVGGAALAAPGAHAPGLMQLLNVLDQVPSRAMLVTAGAGDDGAALVAIARDATLKRYPRMRAAAMLALFEGPAVQRGLRGLLDDPQVRDREVRIQALAALVHLEKGASFDRLRRLANDPDPELRAAALRNLGRIEHPEKQAVLQSRIQAERLEWVRDVAERLTRSRTP